MRQTLVRTAVLAAIPLLEHSVKHGPGEDCYDERQLLIAYLAAALTKSWADPILKFLSYFQRTQKFRETSHDFDLTLHLLSWRADQIRSANTVTAELKLKQLAELLVHCFCTELCLTVSAQL